MAKCDTCKANKVCDHDRFGFENCGSYIAADVVPRETADRLMCNLKAVLDERAEEKIEVAREIFEEINSIKKEFASGDIDGNELYIRLYMLEKKYTEENQS